MVYLSHQLFFVAALTTHQTQFIQPNYFVTREQSHISSTNMTSQQALQPAKPLTRTQRIEVNAAIIWPGQGRSFELDFETDDHVHYSCVLLELCGEPGDYQTLVPRTMTILHRSTELAAQALDKVEDMVRYKRAKEQQRRS
jgi:hypothetical protein